MKIRKSPSMTTSGSANASAATGSSKNGVDAPSTSTNQLSTQTTKSQPSSPNLTPSGSKKKSKSEEEEKDEGYGGSGGIKRGSFTQHQNDNCSDMVPTSKALHISLEDNPHMIVYEKMEKILKRMQSEENGVPVRNVKSFMNKIPSVFTGQDLISWLVTNMDFCDVNEALLFANRMAASGYFFPIDDHVLAVKNDGTYYRFQTPYYWPSKNWAPENTDYAVYLCKRTMQNKARLELADYEAENLARLQKMFSRKWEYIFMQAESQSKVDRKRDKQERKILDTQERAFWDVYRPPPGCVNTTELDIKKVCKFQNSPSKDTDNLRFVVPQNLSTNR